MVGVVGIIPFRSVLIRSLSKRSLDIWARKVIYFLGRQNAGFIEKYLTHGIWGNMERY